MVTPHMIQSKCQLFNSRDINSLVVLLKFMQWFIILVKLLQPLGDLGLHEGKMSITAKTINGEVTNYAKC